MRGAKQSIYKHVDGLNFSIETKNAVCEALTLAMRDKRKVIIHYGDVKTGKDWRDKTDCIGYITKNTRIGIPMLTATKTSIGFPVVDNRIVRISTITGRTLYKHQLYHE